MTGPPRDEFVDRVRRLDQGALTDLVADVYDARGWRTDVVADGRVVARLPRGERTERRAIRVVGSLPADADDADTVVVGDAVDVDRLPDGTRVVDARALHGMVLYAIDRDRVSSLLADHFGARAFEGREWALDRWIPSISVPRPAVNIESAAAVALVAALVALAMASSVGFDESAGPGDGGERTLTPAPVSGNEATAAADTPSVASPCPRPPANAHPATLRPAPVDAAVSVGLEGWEITGSLNVSYFHGPNELEVPYRPEVRHKATYRSPRGTVIGLIVDRWADRAEAGAAGPALSDAYRTAIVWGRYTVAAAVFDRSATGEPESTANAEVYTLFSHVINPDAGRLGVQCVHHVTVEPGD